MKLLHLPTLIAAMAALPTLAAVEADAQQRSAGSGLRINIPSPANHFSWERGHGFHGIHGGVFIVEREVPVIVEREVVREVPAKLGTPNTELGTINRNVPKPYVIGGTYASLPPQGCMKLIEDGASYYFCSGDEWYRQLGAGSGAKYRAVARP